MIWGSRAAGWDSWRETPHIGTLVNFYEDYNFLPGVSPMWHWSGFDIFETVLDQAVNRLGKDIPNKILINFM